jgi:hypothetical protein
MGLTPSSVRPFAGKLAPAFGKAFISHDSLEPVLNALVSIRS